MLDGYDSRCDDGRDRVFEALSHRAIASSARSPAGSFRSSESEGDIGWSSASMAPMLGASGFLNRSGGIGSGRGGTE